MNWKEDPRWAYVFVNLSCLLWASNFVLGRSLREEIGPLMLTTSRVAVASLFYAVILGRAAIKERLLFRHWVLLTGMALTGVLGFPFLLYRGLQLTTATDAVLINATGPLMTAVLAAILLKEQLFPRHVLGGVITFFGVALIVSGASFERLHQWHVNVGDLYILAVGGEPTTINWSWHLVLAVLYIGIFPSALAFLSWNEGVHRVGANRAMVFYNMLPVYGSILGVILLGESLGAQHFIGGGLILGGSLIAIWPELRTATGER